MKGKKFRPCYHFLLYVAVAFAACGESADAPIVKNDSVGKFDVTDSARRDVVTDSTMLTLNQLDSIKPTFSGYKVSGKSSGESYARRTSGGIQSHLRQEYQSANPNRSLIFEIVDYELSRDVFEGLMSMYKRNAGVVNQKEVWRQEHFSDSLVIISTVYPESKTTRIVAGIGNRFLIILNATDRIDRATIGRLVKELPVRELLAIANKSK
jgi:hypothetical protein